MGYVIVIGTIPTRYDYAVPYSTYRYRTGHHHSYRNNGTI
jgi:hypothetical protein